MDVKIEVPLESLFDTETFRDIGRWYFNEFFSKIYDKYKLTPAKGSTKFERISDLPYPFHILNGLIPTMILLERELASEVNLEDPDIKMLIKCAFIGFTFHDVNKLVNKVDLIDAVEKDLPKILESLGIKLTQEEFQIVKFLIVATENRTRYSVDVQLPTRKGLNRVILDYIVPKMHHADIWVKFSEDHSSALFEIYKKLKLRYPDIHVFTFDTHPYECISRLFVSELIRYIVERRIGKPLLANSKGVIWIGKSLESEIDDFVNTFKNTVRKSIFSKHDAFSKLTKIDNQTFQPLIFQYLPPDKANISKLVDLLCKDDSLLFSNLPKANREIILDEIEKIKADETKLRIFALLKMLLQLRIDKSKSNLRNLKVHIVEKYKQFLDKDKDTLQKLGKDVKNPKLNNHEKLIAITNGIFKTGKVKQILDELFADLSTLLQNAIDSIPLDKVIDEILSFARLDGMPIKDPEIANGISSKDQICAICGREAHRILLEAIAFGFKPRGATSRTITTLRNERNLICDICSVEFALRKILTEINTSNELFVAYIDAHEYCIPLMHCSVDLEYKHLTEQMTFIQYDLAPKPHSALSPFMIRVFKQPQKTEDYISIFKDLLEFAVNTGFKVYVTYPTNPSRPTRETIVFDYYPKQFKQLGWNKLRIDELKKVLEELEILEEVARISGRRIVGILDRYASDPLSVFYFAYRGKTTVNLLKDLINLVSRRLGGEIVHLLKEVAKLGVKIERGGRSRSSKTWIYREAYNTLKRAKYLNAGKEDTIALMVGSIYKKARKAKTEDIFEFCKAFYEKIYEKLWDGKIPSSTIAKNAIYALGAIHDVLSREESKEENKEDKNSDKSIAKLNDFTSL